jgi:hypothetical protein
MKPIIVPNREFWNLRRAQIRRVIDNKINHRVQKEHEPTFIGCKERKTYLRSAVRRVQIKNSTEVVVFLTASVSVAAHSAVF